MKRLLLPVVALVCAAVIQTALLATGIVFNPTPSLPRGFYRRTAGTPGKGAFVLLRLPPGQLTSRPYARETLLKQVVGVPGDRVCMEAAGVSVNGVLLANSEQLATDRDGLPLPHPILKDYALGAGEFLTMSAYNPRSFDSRYFGPVRRGDIVAVVEPVFTWR